ncbi:MAG: CHAT domain-containing tetratricopeptide repeat protein [Planctomycetota bacterium]|nr:CHAT domain-containing tetratricopeptide repeat protein [Planctomycetota bacterium]
MSNTADAAALLAELLAHPFNEQAVRLAQMGQPDELIPDFAEEAARWAISDLDRALSAASTLVALSDAIAGPRARSCARRALAQALAYASRHEEALKIAHESIALAEEAGRPVDAARARLATLHVLDRMGQPHEAIAAGQAARATFLATGESVLAARADVNLGIVHRARNDPATALKHFSRARPVLAEDPVIAAQVDSNRAEALLELNDFAGAEAAFKSALEAFESAGVARAAAVVEGNLADLMSRQGRLDRALLHFENARRHFEKNQAEGDLARVARLEAEEAEAFTRAGLTQEALEAYRVAIPRLDEHGLIWEATRARTSFGGTLHKLGHHREADQVLAEAARAYRSREHDAGYARTCLMQGELAWMEGDRKRAQELFEKALAGLGERPAEAAVVRHHLASSALEQGRLAEAADLLEEALDTARRHDLAPLLADLLHTRAKVREARGEPAMALGDLRAAADEVERMRGSLQAERLRAAFVGERATVYEELVLALLAVNEAGAVDEAFHSVERAKSRTLLDVASGAISVDSTSRQSSPGGSASPLLRETAQLRAELNALYSRVFDATAPERSPAALAQWRQSIERSERRLENLESRLAATDEFAGLFAPPTELREVQRLLSADTALIEYFIARDELLAFVVRGDSIHVSRELASRPDVEEQVESLQFQLARSVNWISAGTRAGEALRGDTQRELDTLHRTLIEPLSARLHEINKLIVIPHGPLHAVPFHALHDDRGYVIEKFDVSYAPSASLLSHLGAARVPERPPRSPVPPLVLGLADEAAPHIEEEARGIANVLGGASALTGRDATRANLARQARGAPTVHLACHARFSPEAPLSSGLKLADGWLTVRDLHELRLDGAVVVLSGCDTGRSAVRAGDELTGFARGFIAAGASAVIMSLWTLSDDSAQKVMAMVYDAWHNAEPEGRPSLAAALRQAQCAMIRENGHPVLWGPFVHVGRP